MTTNIAKPPNSLNANDLIAHTQNQLVTRQFELNKGQHDQPHQHPWHQLLFSRSGTLRTQVSNMHYFIPPKRAVVIPAGVTHESWAIVNAEFVGIYFTPRLATHLRSDCRIIEMSALLRELALTIVDESNAEQKSDAKEQRLIAVFADQLERQPEVNMELTLPQDARLQPMVTRLCAQPCINKTLLQWSQLIGASERTIARLFLAETGLSFARWRNKLRLLNSLPMIELQTPIKAVALNVGFSSSAAFIHSFRKEFGVTPKQYFC